MKGIQYCSNICIFLYNVLYNEMGLIYYRQIDWAIYLFMLTIQGLFFFV